MPRYAFILGRNPLLSAAEIKAVLPNGRPVLQTDAFLVIESAQAIDGIALLDQLGGTIKIGEVIGTRVDKQMIVSRLEKIHSSGKLNFGLSYYGCQPTTVGLEIKRRLKELGISSRLVVSRDRALSSVVVHKNKTVEFLVLANQFLAQTIAVQAFEEYSKRDFGRPARDTKSGTLPPKLAKIMINLAQAPRSAVMLDPFCGSGTVLQEALLLGYKKVIGSDLSDKAVAETKQNLEWLKKSHSVGDFSVSKADVRQLHRHVARADVVVSEPYLGPPLRGGERGEQLEKIIKELEALYLAAFAEFKKILPPRGRVVIVIPQFRQQRTLNITAALQTLGFKLQSPADLVYSRPDQKVFRQIVVFEKT